jgi:hypothetical protein
MGLDTVYHLQELCCYGPDNCDDRDISIVCPGYTGDEVMIVNLYPNPVTDLLNIEVITSEIVKINLVVYNAYGDVLQQRELGNINYLLSKELDVSTFEKGIYILQLRAGSQIVTKRFVKY